MKQTPELTPQIRVRETEILATDSRQQYREKLARITLDSMVQFVGLLDAQGTVLEINKVALDAVGISLADVEGKPFWTTFWWQVSVKSAPGSWMASRARAEFVRWDTPIYGRAGGKETIVIDASLCRSGRARHRRLHCGRGPRHPQKNAYEQEIARKNVELRGCSSASASSTRSRPSSLPTSATSCGRRLPDHRPRRAAAECRRQLGRRPATRDDAGDPA